MLNSLKKPTAAPAKKPLTQAQRAEAVAAAVAAAEAAQAKKNGAKTPAASVTAASKTPAKASASSDKPKEAKEANGASSEEAAKEEENGEDDKDDGEEEEKAEKGQSGEAKAAMKNMTGYQPEVERSGVDSTKLEKAMSLLTDVGKKQKAEKAAAHKEVEKVTLAKEDVELVMAEFELTKPVAEKYLKEHGGNVIKTLDALVLA
ncbi:hypothetical protein BGZ74_010847 [Mortierella antarctica]|nr:hypothetical protein BGZ74_010847 [Mortierella antarctica]